MSNELLTSELSSDPVALGYAGKTPAQKAAILNDVALRPGDDRVVQITEVMEYLRARNLWLPIKSATATNVGAAAAVDLNGDMRAQSIDFNLPIAGLMLASLVSAGLLSQDQADAIAAMKRTAQSRAQELGLGSVSAADVSACGG